MIKANSAVPLLSLFQLLTAGRLKGRNVANIVFVEDGPQRQKRVGREIQAKCHRGNTRYILPEIYYPSSAINVAYSCLLLRTRQFSFGKRATNIF